MPTMRVKTKFEAKDDVSSVARRIESNVRKMNRDMDRGFKQSARSALKFGGVLKANLLSAGISKGMGLLSQGVGEVATQFISFDDAITAAAVRFKDIGPDSKDFALQLDTIKKAAREAGATTVFTSTQSAQAMDFFARAGWSSVEAMGSLKSMIDLSVATGEDFASVANWSTDLLGSFGLAVDDSAQKVKNLARLNDVLVKAANSANVTVEDMFETFKISAPIAKQFGASLEEMAALNAVLANSGIKASQAATAEKNIFTRLARPTKEVNDALAELRLSQNDFIKDGKRLKITDILEKIGKGLDGVAEHRRLGIISQIFGAFAIAGGANLVDSIRNIREYTDAMNEANGINERSAEVMGRSLGPMITKLGSGFADLGFEILGGEEKFKNFIDSTTKRVNKLASVLKSFREEETRPTGTSGAENRRVLDMLNQGGKFSRIPVLTNIADLIGVAAFGQTIDEMATEQMARRLRSETIENNRRSTASDFFRTDNIIFQQPPQPNLNVSVENKITAKDVNVESTVKAPGTSGGPGANRY